MMNSKNRNERKAYESNIINLKQGQTNLLSKGIIKNQTRIPLIINKGCKINKKNGKYIYISSKVN